MLKHREETKLILDCGESLLVAPAYIGKGDDPIVKELINRFPEYRAKILSPHSPGDVLDFFWGHQTILLYYLPVGKENVLDFAFQDIFKEIIDRKAKTIAVSLFGIFEYGYDEGKSRNLWLHSVEDFLRKNLKIAITSVTPPLQYRPANSKGVRTDSLEDEKKEIKSSHLTHQPIVLKQSEIKCYRDYFKQYIKSRDSLQQYIRTEDGPVRKGFGKSLTQISALDDLGWVLAEYLIPVSRRNDKPYPMSKWAGKAKDKNGKVYSPKPSKEMLKLIILVLDMNFDEAIHCLNFFGYSLAAFDEEDKAFSYILTHWEPPLSPYKVHLALVKRFGASAGLCNLR